MLEKMATRRSPLIGWGANAIQEGGGWKREGVVSFAELAGAFWNTLLKNHAKQENGIPNRLIGKFKSGEGEWPGSRKGGDRVPYFQKLTDGSRNAYKEMRERKLMSGNGCLKET